MLPVAFPRFLVGFLLAFAVGSAAVWWRIARFPEKLFFPAPRSSGIPAGTAPGLPKSEGPGGPILVISNSLNPFSSYYSEILRAEGLNEFAVLDISRVRAETLDRMTLFLWARYLWARQKQAY